jgi:hypothetical protein
VQLVLTVAKVPRLYGPLFQQRAQQVVPLALADTNPFGQLSLRQLRLLLQEAQHFQMGVITGQHCSTLVQIWTQAIPLLGGSNAGQALALHG